MWDSIVNSFVQSAKDGNPVEDGDYVDDEGLLCCGKCHTRKQMRIEILGRKVEPMIPCKCRKETLEKEEQEEKLRLSENESSRMRNVCFHDRTMKEWTFENDDGKSPRIIKIAKRYVDKFSEMKKDHKGLLLFGGVGVGKTYASACIANALIDKGIPCMVTNFPRMVRTMEGLHDRKQEFLDQLDDYDLLVIDDLASERNTEYMQEFVMQIIDARDRSGLPIIVTTNLTAHELKTPSDMQKQRIYSRLFSMCIPIEVKGEDRRKGALRAEFNKYSDILGLEDD